MDVEKLLLTTAEAADFYKLDSERALREISEAVELGMNVANELPTTAESPEFLGRDVGKRVLLTTREAAKFLRLSPRSLEKKRVQGTGPRYIKLGPGVRTRVVYDLNDLLAWLERSHLLTSEYAD